MKSVKRLVITVWMLGGIAGCDGGKGSDGSDEELIRFPFRAETVVLSPAASGRFRKAIESPSEVQQWNEGIMASPTATFEHDGRQFLWYHEGTLAELLEGRDCRVWEVPLLVEAAQEFVQRGWHKDEGFLAVVDLLEQGDWKPTAAPPPQ